MLAQAPPLSQDQRERIAALLRNGGGGDPEPGAALAAVRDRKLREAGRLRAKAARIEAEANGGADTATGGAP